MSALRDCLLLVVYRPEGDDGTEDNADDIASDMVDAYNKATGRTGATRASVELIPSPQWVTTDQLKWLMRALWQTRQAVRTARYCAKVLKMADLYLDGFVWITEPEFSELRRIKHASKKAQAAVEKIGPVPAAPRRPAPDGVPA